MVREIVFSLPSQPIAGTKFKIYIVSESEFFNASPEWTFVGSPSEVLSNYYIYIGADLNSARSNLHGQIFAWVFNNASSFITSQITPTGTKLIMTAEDVNSATVSNTSNLAISHTTTVNPTASEINYILSRSTYFVDIAPTFLFDEATMLLKIWHGNKTIDKPTLPTYNLSKLVVIAGQTNITFDVHKIVNDYVKNKIIAFGQTQTAFTSSKFDTVWLEAQITASYQDEPLATTTKKYLALDGYGYHTEGYNPIVNNKTLISINDHIVYDGQNYPIYFKTFELTSIVINGQVVPFSFNTEDNSQAIGYVNIKPFLNGTENFTGTFTYGTEVITHNFTVKSSCLFPFVNSLFKNKFGFWQSMPFNMVSKKSIDITNSDYTPFVSNFGRYNVTDHNKVSYNVNGKEKITCNTDFIPEHYVEVMQQLLLSEQIYLEMNGEVLPANKITKSLSKKTKAVDKLIQYSMDFEYSFNIINQIV